MHASTISPERPWPYRPAPRAAIPSARAHLLAGMARLAAPVLRWHRARHATRQLMALDDRMLRDIGHGRGEVERAAATGRERT
jgi:uncharacterized protein YjiS (DUF1127 family)